MKDLPPEVAGQLALSVPLFALGLALFLTAFLLVAGALLSLLPHVYENRETKPNNKLKAFLLLIVIAIVCIGLGWLTLSGLSSQLTDATTIMSSVEENK